MGWFEIIGLSLLGGGGAFVGYIGLRNDPRLVRKPWEGLALVVLGVGAWVIALLILMGVV